MYISIYIYIYMWIKQALILLFITPSFPVHIYIYFWAEEPILARMTWLGALDADQVGCVV